MHIAILAARIIVGAWAAMLVIRWGVDYAARLRVLARALKFRPVALGLEFLYGATDPALKPLHKHVPPVRLGSVPVDLSYILLLILASIVNAGLDRF